jgi:isopentenyl diphosphate isomerase/L-lactate dehydrogenase-like FMN-dependent dehydrogenase
MLAPIGVLELAHPDGDLAVARAARETGVPMIISSQASHPMEEIAKNLGDAPRLFQLYHSKSHVAPSKSIAVRSS